MFVMLMLTVPALMVLIIASERKDTLKMDSLVNVDKNSDTSCRAKQLSIISIFFVTEVIITSRKRNDFQAPTTYFYKVTGFIISIHTHFSKIRADILRVAYYFFESERNDDKLEQ